MITREALRQLDTESDDDSTRSMLLQWTDQGSLPLSEGLPRRERFRVLEEHFAAVKEPLLVTLREAGVTVKDLPASSQAIVQATSAQWRELLDREHLRSDPSVEILPNMMFHTLDQK